MHTEQYLAYDSHHLISVNGKPVTVFKRALWLVKWLITQLSVILKTLGFRVIQRNFVGCLSTNLFTVCWLTGSHLSAVCPPTMALLLTSSWVFVGWQMAEFPFHFRLKCQLTLSQQLPTNLQTVGNLLVTQGNVILHFVNDIPINTLV